MIKVRCKNYGNCPLELDDGVLHEYESIDSLGCPLRQRGAGCAVEEQSDGGILDRVKEIFGGLFKSPLARLCALGCLDAGEFVGDAVQAKRVSRLTYA